VSSNGAQISADKAALDHVASTYMESGGDVALTAKRLGWKVEEVRSIIDALALHLADLMESPEGQRMLRGRNMLDARALTQFAMEKMRTTERAGHRWGGLALAGMAHQDRMGGLALTKGEAGMPTVIVVNGEVPPPMAIQADGSGGFVKAPALSDGVPVPTERAEP
jgi:hypothetical protein